MFVCLLMFQGALTTKVNLLTGVPSLHILKGVIAKCKASGIKERDSGGHWEGTIGYISVCV